MPALAVVTGVTSGIGRVFAERLAGEGYALVLVSRDEGRMAAVADGLRGTTTVETLVADLADAEQRAAVEQLLTDRPVDLLVNNAGHGLGTSFLDTDPAAEDAMFEVNAHAVLRLTRAALPGMVERRRGAIINVASVAAWVPRGSYAASKAYVLALSRSADLEARAHGVRVQALCPGLTHTEFHARAGSDAPARTPGFLWLSAERVVEESLAGLARGRSVVVPGRRWRLMMLGNRMMPVRLSVWLARRGHGQR